MAYADVADVQARLGRFAPILAASGAQQHPNEDDAAAMLDDVTAEIDSAIEARGFDPASLDERAQTALKDLAAFGAIARLLAGVPADDDLSKLHEYARRVWAAAMGDPTATQESAVRGSFRTGAHPVIADLEAGRAGGGAGASAGDLWSEEPEAGTVVAVDAEAAQVAACAVGPGQVPQFFKGMSG